MPRILLTLALLAALLPAALLRDPPEPRPTSSEVVFHRLEPARGSLDASGPVQLAGAWRITSGHDQFGSYSALLTLPDGGMTAISDRGAVLSFARPDRAGSLRAHIAVLANARGTLSKRERDAEAATLDSATGRVWVSYERSNTIVRFTRGFHVEARAAPAGMADWPVNRGAEAMVRLADGRFIVLSEAQVGGGSHPALLFAGDPARRGAKAIAFRYRAPAGYRPTAMAQLGDGRVLILNRALAPPWRFQAKLTLADSRRIVRGGLWRGREVARIGPPWPADNYEGIAITREADGSEAIWLISDDNQAALVQQTLLLKLRWRPDRLRTPAD